MNRQLRRLILGFHFASSIALAEGGVLGAGARYANVVGMQGALQNRATANSLYRQSLRDERESRRTHDHGLHRKAVREASRARAADGQGRAFASAALQAMVTTMMAGQVKQSEAKDVDVAQLREIAHVPNPLAKELAELLDENEIAANDVGEGEFTVGAETETPTIAKVEKESEAPKASTRAPTSITPSASGGPGAPGAPLAGAVVGGASVAPNTFPAPKVAPNFVAIATETPGGFGGLSRNERADQIERDRKVFLKKMGVGKVPPAEVRAEKESNIFDVIHARYQTMRGADSFMEYLEHPEQAARGSFGH